QRLHAGKLLTDAFSLKNIRIHTNNLRRSSMHPCRIYRRLPGKYGKGYIPIAFKLQCCCLLFLTPVAA
ncbi:MAG: hypothetical protein ACTH6H_18230, partial [Serratia sp. (in: enterobacteria)]